MSKLLDRIAQIRNEEGKDIAEKSSQWLVEKLQKPDDSVNPIALSDMHQGGFYFMMYDLAGKSSKMEQYVPMLLVDYKQVGNTKILFALSLSFIPLKIRLLFFDKLLANFEDVFTPIDSKSKIGAKEQPLSGINYHNVYKWLKTIGFEYAIREFDLRKINKVYEIQQNSLPRFLSIDTKKFTGVDDGKLAQIWETKLKTRDAREKELLKDIYSGFDKVEKTLNEGHKNFKEEMKNLQCAKNSLDDLSKS